MTRKITYNDEPLGDIEVVADFLPMPTELAFREEGGKVTPAFAKSGPAFNFQRSIPTFKDSNEQ
jgi:hypothetical protein